MADHGIHNSITEVVPLSPREQFFNDDTIAALRELGTVLTPIYRRLLADGWVLKDGTLCRKEPVIEA